MNQYKSVQKGQWRTPLVAIAMAKVIRINTALIITTIIVIVTAFTKELSS